MSLMVPVNARSYESKLKDSALAAGYRQHGRTVWRRHMHSATAVADAASGLLALATHALVDAAFTSVRRVVAPLAHALIAISSPVQLARQPTSKAGESWQQTARNLGARDWADVGEVPTPPPIPTPTSHARLHTLMRDLNGSIAPDRRGGAPVRVAVAHACACMVLLTPKCAALYCVMRCCGVCSVVYAVVCCAMVYALLCCVVPSTTQQYTLTPPSDLLSVMTNLRDYARSIPTATMTPQWRGGNSVAWEGKANDFLAAARRRIAGAATSTGAGGGAGAGAGASLPHGDWVCDMCTQQNMSDASACCMCDSPRGTGNQATPTSATMPEDTALKEGIASCLLTFESQIQGSHRVRVAAVYAGSVACVQPCRAYVG